MKPFQRFMSSKAVETATKPLSVRVTPINRCVNEMLLLSPLLTDSVGINPVKIFVDADKK